MVGEVRGFISQLGIPVLESDVPYERFDMVDKIFTKSLKNVCRDKLSAMHKEGHADVTLQ